MDCVGEKAALKQRVHKLIVAIYCFCNCVGLSSEWSDHTNAAPIALCQNEVTKGGYYSLSFRGIDGAAIGRSSYPPFSHPPNGCPAHYGLAGGDYRTSSRPEAVPHKTPYPRS